MQQLRLWFYYYFPYVEIISYKHLLSECMFRVGTIAFVLIETPELFFFSRDKAKQDFVWLFFSFDRIRSHSHQHFYHISLARLFIFVAVSVCCAFILISIHQVRALPKTKYFKILYDHCWIDDANLYWTPQNNHIRKSTEATTKVHIVHQSGENIFKNYNFN